MSEAWLCEHGVMNTHRAGCAQCQEEARSFMIPMGIKCANAAIRVAEADHKLEELRAKPGNSPELIDAIAEAIIELAEARANYVEATANPPRQHLPKVK